MNAKPKSRRRLPGHNKTVVPRSFSPAEEAPFIWAAKHALYQMKDLEFDADERAIYWALIWIGNNWLAEHPGDSDFSASYRQIASYAGCKERTVQRKLPNLVRAGLIGVRSGRRSAQLHEANIYTIASTSTATQAVPSRHAGGSVPPKIDDSLADNKERLTGVLVQPPDSPPAAAPRAVARASRGGDNQPDTARSETARLAAFKRIAERKGMKLATYLKQRAREKGVEVSDLTMPSAAVDNAVVQETTPISAPAEPMHPAPQVQQPVAPLEPVAAPAPVLALTPEELEARKRELLRRQTEYAQAHSLPTAGDARQYCKPGMAPAAPAP